jgi:hypothetical protein
MKSGIIALLMLVSLGCGKAPDPITASTAAVSPLTALIGNTYAVYYGTSVGVQWEKIEIKSDLETVYSYQNTTFNGWDTYISIVYTLNYSTESHPDGRIRATDQSSHSVSFWCFRSVGSDLEVSKDCSGSYVLMTKQ